MHHQHLSLARRDARQHASIHLQKYNAGLTLSPTPAARLELPYLLVFPAIGTLAAVVLAASVRRRRDGPPFYMTAFIFGAAFGTLAISFWPYMIPFSITIEEALATSAKICPLLPQVDFSDAAPLNWLYLSQCIVSPIFAGGLHR